MIKIKESKTADSRTAEGKPGKDRLLASSVQHIGDVQKGIAFFAQKLIEAGAVHDCTKIDGIDDFYDLYSQGLTGDAFKAGKWFKRHVTEERHHLNDHIPEDVTLIDVLERIADISMAGMGRSGRVYDDTLSGEILQKAYQNTVKLLVSNIEVEG
jgi:hypothetical protein